ncbi:uncharacterized protein N7469_003717 [Penicillium citrinum]|jgi:hypothetical protein|uniref:Clock-controlled protein 6 n=2 Tax=Penicillium TaxID=5073 RepID=A0A9W9TRM1_PENCI|nr:uncharacterized protein N7469_003717 [Penicillium citrinum]KAJ5234549.1 hypothetical protein N7469_003717 [Penicillium citrinum]KAJ5590164.1 hypothetical protein N7450_004136 [Penicillium hetheringtonii]
MRFSVAAAITMAAGAFAGVVTETVTDYTTYCPEATSIVHGGSTYSVPSAGTVTLSNGPYTVTRPLVTQTVTQCNKCTSSAVPTAPAVSSSAPASSVPVYSSTPLVPSGADATGAPAPSSPSGAGASTPAPSQPAFNAGTMNAAGAGAGLAAVFGAAALLL